MKTDHDDHAPLVNRFRLALVYGLVLVAIVFMGSLIQFAWRERPEEETLRTQSRPPARKAVRKVRPKPRAVESAKPGQEVFTIVQDRTPDAVRPPVEAPAPDAAPASLPPAQLNDGSHAFMRMLPGSTGPGPTGEPNITGIVRLIGTPPPEKELPLDPTCGRLHTNKPTTRFFVIGENDGLADVLVYIENILPGGTFSSPAPPAMLDQVGCEFTPYVLAMRTGQQLLVRNSDPVLHNIHTTPVMQGNLESSSAQLPNGPDLVYVFNQPELFLRFKCDVHPWMFAYVNVLHHPFFAVTDKDGKFSLPRVPPDDWRLQIVHRKAGTKRTPQFTVPDRGRLFLELELKVPTSVTSVPSIP